MVTTHAREATREKEWGGRGGIDGHIYGYGVAIHPSALSEVGLDCATP
jgi:hypothetical protein